MKVSELQKELRIGNYIIGKCVDELDERKEWWEQYQIKDAEDLMGVKDGWDKRIPLTEEWLMIFGFKKDEYNDDRPFYYTFKGFRLNCNMGFLTLYNSNELAYFRPIELKYVHQLQNMFFSLCGEELELKSI